MDDKRIYLYDCTLRDGAQTQGVDFSATDKAAIASELDRLGIDYIEGGWPGANPTDDAFFANPPTLNQSRLTTFGMTRRVGRSVDNDPGFQALLQTPARTVCIVGKTWDFHVDIAFGISKSENIQLISESISHAVTKLDEAMFDAEHFFDGYKANPNFALSCLKAAYDAGARWIVLCDTNGGTLPHEITHIVTKVSRDIPGSHLGIHCHNDTGNAVANSLAAVIAGVCQVQGTLNGLGERCGNADLISIIPSLILKMGVKTGIGHRELTQITHISRMLDERLNRSPNRRAPYIGESAFTHKGGLHVSVVEKDPRSYEHIVPELVGNRRHIVVSNQAGRSNILARFREIGLDLDASDASVRRLLEVVKKHEHDGYAYDGAEASFELLARRTLDSSVPEYFSLSSFRVIDERLWNAEGKLITQSEATVKLNVDGNPFMTVAEGNGPVNALDTALRNVLLPTYPELKDMCLVDYKVRILTPSKETAAITRVMIESRDSRGKHWSTVGVSANIIDASYNALYDSIVYKLYHDNVGTKLDS